MTQRRCCGRSGCGAITLVAVVTAFPNRLVPGGGRTVMRRMLCVVLLTGAGLPSAHAQGPDPGRYSPDRHEVRESRGHLVRMPDQVRLSVDVYRPASEGRFPG